MSTEVKVESLPECDYCAMQGNKQDAAYDGQTRSGSWANMCGTHFKAHGIGLGTGVGQRLVLEDELEQRRRAELVRVNTEARERSADINQHRVELEARVGQVWNTEEVSRDFILEGFAAPFVVCRRKSDGKRGSLQFQHEPRFYFSFEEAK